MRDWTAGSRSGQIFSGGWTTGGSGTFEILSPVDGALVGTVGVADADNVEQAGLRAAQAQVEWARTSFRERAAVLDRAADVLHANRDEVQALLVHEGGSLVSKAHHEVDKTLDELRAAASLVTAPIGDVLPHEDPSVVSLARRIPVGTVGVIAPWNAPLMLAMRSVAPALALGNAVILKPDIKTALAGGMAIAAIFEEAGLPEGLLHVLPGGPEVGEAVVASPHTHVISFTGSSRAGRRVGEVAGGLMKRVVLELGGNNAIVVLEDADLDTAINAGTLSTFRHQGQICMATGRHLIHENLADEYLARLAEAAQGMRVGDPREAGVKLGPLISLDQAQRVQQIVDAAVREGAVLTLGGSHDGAFYEPTVLDKVSRDNSAFTSEIFGPVAPVTRFHDDAEALALANGTPYGLSAAIHTRDIPRALAFARELKTGMVHINGQTINDAAHVPMGGMGASGNGGRYGGHWNLDEFTYWQWVSIASVPYR